MIHKSQELLRKKQAQHLISVTPEEEDVSLITDSDLIVNKRETSLFAWMFINRTMLILCSMVVLLFVWHRWAVKLSSFSHNFHLSSHIFSDSLYDTDRSPFLRTPKPFPSQTKQNTSNRELKVAKTDKLYQKNSQTNTNEPTSLPYKGCLTSLPTNDQRKHIVPPPKGDVTLVCCNTTAGILNIEVHPLWAPLGAARFLEMVSTNFFSTQVPLFRALRGFLIQFGLSGDPKVHKEWHKKGNLKDDPTWLPLGPRGRSINKIYRYQKGYLAYAGAGKNSRGTQLIVALEKNKFLGGGSPWEVPWGQIVGEESLATLDRIYTGYGEKVSQGKIMNRGIEYIQEEFPLIDVILGCKIVKEKLPWHWQANEHNTNLNIDIRQYHVTDKKPAGEQ